MDVAGPCASPEPVGNGAPSFPSCPLPTAPLSCIQPQCPLLIVRFPGHFSLHRCHRGVGVGACLTAAQQIRGRRRTVHRTLRGGRAAGESVVDGWAESGEAGLVGSTISS